MDAATATAIYSIYMAMVYLLAMPGGWFGDRVWGPRKTVAIAAGIIMAGHLTLALPGGRRRSSPAWDWSRSAPACSRRTSPRWSATSTTAPRTRAATAASRSSTWASTSGAFAAPLVIGTVGQNVNWHLGFALAAVGMALGLVQFLLGTRHLSERSSVVPKPLAAEERAPLAAQGSAVADRRRRLLRRASSSPATSP